MTETKLALSAALAPIDTLWCIEPNYGRQAKQMLDAMDFSAHAKEYAEDKNRFLALLKNDDGEDDDDKPYNVIDGVAVLDLKGVMTKAPTSWGRGCSTTLMRRAVRQAASDNDVVAIGIVIDSPGGQVSGTADLANDVKAANIKKPVGCYIEDCGCSAAYWVASQGAIVHANDTAVIGSIGTVMVVDDTSEAAAKHGVKVHVISTGAYKGAGADGAKVTDDHLADFQRVTEDMNAHFIHAVAEGRDMSLGHAAKLADGRVHVGQNAADLNLVDKIGSFDQFLSALKSKASRAFIENRMKDGSPKRLAEADRQPTADLGTKETHMADEKTVMERLRSFLFSDGTDDGDAGTPARVIVPPANNAANVALNLAAGQKDILALCAANGIQTAGSLKEYLEFASIGRVADSDLRSDAKQQAIRAYGVELGQQVGASADSLPYATIKAMASGWRAEADKMFGIGKDGAAPARASVAKPTATATNAEHGEVDDNKEPWDRLSGEQQKFAALLGADTKEKRNEFAKQYLMDKEAV